MLLFCPEPLIGGGVGDDQAGDTGDTTEQEECAGECQPNYRFLNLHLSVGGAFETGDDLQDGDFGDKGVQGTMGATFAVTEPLAISVMAGYNGFAAGGTKALSDLFVAGGFRLRLLVDRSDAASEKGGNVFGNLWADLHLGYNRYNRENHAGYNVGVGYQFSLAKDIKAGPYVRVQVTPIGKGLGYSMIALGIEVSLGAKLRPDDRDGDGIWDEDDRCAVRAEDMDGFEDADGCPDEDNDGDGVRDEADACPDMAEDVDGFEDADGCPDEDNDGDGISDAGDKCPD